MFDPGDNGITQRFAKGSVDEVVKRLLSTLKAKAIKVFAIVDHSDEARKAGLEMPPTNLIIFGNRRPELHSCLPCQTARSTCRSRCSCRRCRREHSSQLQQHRLFTSASWLEPCVD